LDSKWRACKKQEENALNKLREFQRQKERSPEREQCTRDKLDKCKSDLSQRDAWMT
jgi:hypothetical protein